MILVELPIVYEAALRQLAIAQLGGRSTKDRSDSAEAIAQQMLECSIQERFESLANMTLGEYQRRGCPYLDLLEGGVPCRS